LETIALITLLCSTFALDHKIGKDSAKKINKPPRCNWYGLFR